MTTNPDQPTSRRSRHHRFSFSPKFITIISSAILVILVVIFVILTIINRPSSDDMTETDQFISDITQEVITVIGDDNDYQAGIDKWDEYIVYETDDATLAKLYDARADQLYSYYTGDENELLKTRIFADVYAAEAVNPTAETAMSIYAYETYLGDKDIAQQYRQTAFERDPELKTMLEGGKG